MPVVKAEVCLWCGLHELFPRSLSEPQPYGKSGALLTLLGRRGVPQTPAYAGPSYSYHAVPPCSTVGILPLSKDTYLDVSNPLACFVKIQ